MRKDCCGDGLFAVLPNRWTDGRMKHRVAEFAPLLLEVLPRWTADCAPRIADLDSEWKHEAL
jgi:hypothetical protein